MSKSRTKTRTGEKSKPQPDKKTVIEEKTVAAEQEVPAAKKKAPRKDADSSKVSPQPEQEKPQPQDEAAARTYELEQQLADVNDRLLRKIAEFDNYRKRTFREHIATLENASGHLMEKLLPVLDDLEQLEKLKPEHTNATTLYEGLALITKKAKDILQKEGLEIIPTLEKPFDPELHEVLAVMEDPEKEPGAILVEQQKGYRLKGRVLRHSRVVVNKDEQ